MSSPPRLKLQDLSSQQVQPLNDAIPEQWPSTWRDIAISVFVSLISSPAWRELQPQDLALLATQGIAEDLGGTQPYIPTGSLPKAVVRTTLVLQKLKEGCSYRQVALVAGLTESRVRKIEAEKRRKDKKTRQ